MTRLIRQEELTREELEAQLSSELIASQESVLRKFSIEKDRDCSLHSLHGTIGGKNRQYADVVNNQFSDPKEFIAHWLKGFIDYVGDYRYSPLRNLLKDEEFRNYTFTFLERNFYRNLIARTRFKPDDNLWSIWFGNGKLVWGLVIAPAYRNEMWTNDVSEIRRADYRYWTIGHVVTTGLIDPLSATPLTFGSVGDLLTFYRSILKRVSNSQYEQSFCELYIDYLSNSKEQLEEPFLVPEFRYAGLEVEHEHRLDFTILNPHTRDLIGFELSPHSTHMAVKGIKDKFQKDVNAELSEKWDKEMRKRNDYFSTFGITTITFTDNDLKDTKNCFETVKKYLSARPKETLDLNEEIKRISGL